MIKEDDKILVSVIIPVYNVQTYLKRCLDSIIEQSYSNIEIILINDGSTDESFLICEKYKEKDNRIHLISQSNKGLSVARNVGITISKGAFITFIDSDDYVDRNYIEVLLNNMLDNDVDIVMCDIVDVYKNNNIINSPFKNESFQAIKVFEKSLQTNGWFYTMAQAKLFRSSLVKQNLFLPAKIHEDEYFSNQLYSIMDLKVHTTKFTHYYYVHRCDGIMGNAIKFINFDEFDAFYQRMEIAKKNRLNCVRQLYERCHLFLSESVYSDNLIHTHNKGAVKRIFKMFFSTPIRKGFFSRLKQLGQLLIYTLLK